MPPSPPLLTSKPTALQLAAAVAAAQALITHVQSPLPMGGCVTPVDHFAVLFLIRFGHGRSITQQGRKKKEMEKRKPYFHCTAVLTST